MRRRAVDRLLVEYLELPETKQAGWLARTRQRFPRLSRWLDEMTDGGHTVTLLDGSVRNLADQAVQSLASPVKALEPDTRLGPWVVREAVGQGGMGMVYRGERADGAFEMDVAIKLIGKRRRGLAELLQRESRLLARLDHPSVTRLVDAGLDEQAGPFLVMEWVEGTDLAQWLKDNEPPLAQRLELFCQLAEATAHAHQRLIVHGDIKPGNVRIREDGTVKLMDFGVARLMEAGESEDDDLRALTPAFAAPEQREGEAVTPASDIWSLGATLYWLLTGQRIQDNGIGVEQVLSARTISRRQELAAVIMTACDPDPEQRYTAASELLAELKRYRRNEPLMAYPATAFGRAIKFARRNRLAVGTGSLLALSVLIGLAVSSSLYFRAEHDRAVAERAERAARTVTGLQQDLLSDMDPATLADGLVLGLRKSIGQAGLPDGHMQAFNEILDAASPVDIMREQLVENVLDPARSRFEQAMGDDSETDAALQHSLASVYLRWGLYEEALNGFELAYQMHLNTRGPAHPDTLATRLRQATTIGLIGDTARSMTMLKEARVRGLQSLPEHHPEILNLSHEIGSRLLRDGRFEEAVQVFTQLLELRQREFGEDSPEALDTAGGLASAHMAMGNIEQAGPLLEHVFQTQRRTLGDHHRSTLGPTNNLAVFKYQTGEVEDALELFELTSNIAIENWGRNHPNALFYKYNHAQALYAQGDLESALKLHKKVFEGRRALFGATDTGTLLSSGRVAVTLFFLGRHEQALSRMSETFHLLVDTLGPDHYRTLDARQRLGEMMVKTGEAEQGLSHLGQAHDRLQQLIGPFNEATLNALGRRLRAKVELGLYRQGHEIIVRDPALVESPEKPAQVTHFRSLYTIIADLYDDWHAAEPESGYDGLAEKWHQRRAGLD